MRAYTHTLTQDTEKRRPEWRKNEKKMWEYTEKKEALMWIRILRKYIAMVIHSPHKMYTCSSKWTLNRHTEIKKKETHIKSDKMPGEGMENTKGGKKRERTIFTTASKHKMIPSYFPIICA